MWYEHFFGAISKDMEKHKEKEAGELFSKHKYWDCYETFIVLMV